MRGVLQQLRRTAVGQQVATAPIRRRYWWPSWRAVRILLFDYGHLRSVRAGQAMLGKGEVVPWYTYPAIEFLRQFDFTGMRVFEWGAGHSTLFWAERAAHVVSVEDEEDWVEQLRPRLPSNCTLRYEPDLRRYPGVIAEVGGAFDVIVVDGPGRAHTRMKCAVAALPHLKPGGLIILDNSDWVPETAATLRDADLLQVDMSGFAPIAPQTQTTSLFFHRECRLRPLGRQPAPSVGARAINWDTPRRVDGQAPDIVHCDERDFAGVLHDEQLTKVSPAGVRRFRILVHAGGEGPQIALLDSDANRVLLVAHRPKTRDVMQEVIRLREMSWQEFREFVRRHEYRYYVLE